MPGGDGAGSEGPGPGRYGEWHRLYDRRWAAASRAYLSEHTSCAMCERRGALRRSEVTDHIVPHRGDLELFWRRENWQPLCKRCHDGRKAAEELRGYSDAVGADGWPLDPRHPANQRLPPAG